MSPPWSLQFSSQILVVSVFTTLSSFLSLSNYGKTLPESSIVFSLCWRSSRALLIIQVRKPAQSSPYGTVGLAAVSLYLWDAGLVPGLAQWVKDLVVVQLQRRSQPRLGSDPWPGNPVCCRVARKEKKRKKMCSERMAFVNSRLS